MRCMAIDHGEHINVHGMPGLRERKLAAARSAREFMLVDVNRIWCVHVQLRTYLLPHAAQDLQRREALHSRPANEQNSEACIRAYLQAGVGDSA